MLLTLLAVPFLAFGDLATAVGDPPTVPLIAISANDVTCDFNTNGLSSIKWNNTEFLSSNVCRMNWVGMVQPDGAINTADSASTTSVNVSSKTITASYGWGTLTCAYSTEANRLLIDVTIANTSALAMDSFILALPELKFPETPREFTTNISMLGHNIAAPTVFTASFGSGIMAVTNEAVTEPLMVALPWPLESTHTVFPLMVNTGRNSMYPTSLPRINRPIPAGGSLHFRLALRFGPPGSSVPQLAGDIFQKYAAAFPFTFHWADRRPIAEIIMCRSATGWPTNPRGWFNDPTVDVTTAAGLAHFRARMFAYADRCIAVEKSVNAQGIVAWDMEGEEFPHGTSFIGDPRLIDTLAPEASGLIDEWFAKFRAAGLRIGATLRPQKIVLTNHNTGAFQQELNDPSQNLIDKITYAKNRWGMSIFYIDSNGDKNSPVDTRYMARVAAAHPDVLLIPEMSTVGYHAFCAPYGSVADGDLGASADALNIYPKAVRTIVTSDADLARNHAALVRAVRRGNILFFRGWWDGAPELPQVKSIYHEAHAPAQ